MTTQTRISDLVASPGVLAPLVAQRFKINNTLITSGLAVTSALVQSLMNGGSQDQGVKFINKVDTTQFNHSNDNYDDKGAVGKLTGGSYTAHRFDLNWGWAYTDMLNIITKFDPHTYLPAVAIPLFWNEVAENFAVASMKGAIASDAEMTLDGGTSAFSVDMIIDAEVELDGPATNLIVSKRTLAKLKKANAAAYQGPQSDVNIHFAKYADYNLIVTEAFGDETTIIASDGALAFATGVVPGEVAMEYGRDVDAGNGGGGEILRTRRSLVVAPQGFSYTGTIGENEIEKPSLAQLANADMWDRKAGLDFIGFRAIKHAK
ncbi:hypothetical protein [Sphingomonas sp. CFBP 13706]|uniref:hypothetical protein n=1 Tax=Sphingomonas sp. CFBP 13706 TaxID=2775314 RepID=UPI0017828250|nr:hypothetical protein [Sphingomonas sp. CFBP 13706]MBD8734893.1 hypothetical protein [Sphingomonas sp. CFBP 13706]